MTTSTASAAPRIRAALALATLSGGAALGLQLVWVQQASLWLGHEAPAVLAVVAAFFGGLAFGALALAGPIARARRPARAYAACEAVVAAWALLLAAAMGPLAEALLQLTGARPSAAWQWSVAFGGSFAVLLPATAAMGASLPAMAAVLARLAGVPADADEAGSVRALAPVYAANTAGAVAGALGAALWGVPVLGLSGTAVACAAVDIACAAGALRLAAGARSALSPSAAGQRSADGRGLLATLALTGWLGIGYEVLVVRVLGQVTEDTVYTFALLLAVYLVGTSAGAAMLPRLSPRWRDRLLPLQALACLAGTATLWGAESVRDAVIANGQGIAGPMAAALAAEAVLAALAFALPTLVMGALFADLAARAQARGQPFARALGVNTLGAALAPPVFGVALAPALGPKAALLLVAAGYVALALPRAGARRWAAAPVAAAAVLALWTPPLAYVDLPPGGRVLSYREGTLAAVSVVEDASGVATLRINNRAQEGSSATLVADARQALLPLLLHPAPRRALFLGLGTGVTAASAAADPTLRVEVVELLPEVAASTGRFVAADAMARLEVVVADARRYVRAGGGGDYDVVVADNVHPARSGTGALYTVEHFAAVRARLADGGLFCQWLPLHQLDLPTLRSIVRSYLTVFPDARAMLATHSLSTPVLGLVGGAGARFALADVQARLAAPTMPQALPAYGLDDPWAVLGSLVAGPRALAAFAGDAPPNTDDRPVVAYRAPRATYAPAEAPADRLLALLAALPPRDDDAIEQAGAADAARLRAYRQARAEFLRAGRGVAPSSDVRAMLAQVGAPLLAVLRTSPDFRPAYDPLLRMAGALARVDAPAARDLLQALREVQPARAEAALALEQVAATRAGGG